MPLVIEIDPTELEGLALSLDLDKKAMQRAARVAANRAIRWARVQVARGLSTRLGVPQTAFMRRTKERNAKGRGSRASLWIALNPLNAAKAGARKTATGLRAGNVDLPGAFIGKGRYGGRVAMQRKGAARYPLKAASLDVLTAGREVINLQTWPELQARFLGFYTEELERRR